MLSSSFRTRASASGCSIGSTLAGGSRPCRCRSRPWAQARLTDADSSVGAALIFGAGFAHVLVQDDNKLAWSPNGAALLTFRTSEKIHLTTMGRYVYLAIPTAPGGPTENFVHIAGTSVGLKIDIAERISFLPEVGAYWYEGRILDRRTAGPGFQYGAMLATSF